MNDGFEGHGNTGEPVANQTPEGLPEAVGAEPAATAAAEPYAPEPGQLSGPAPVVATPAPKGPKVDRWAMVREESQPRYGGHEPVHGRPLEVAVDDRGVERALRRLRRLMASEGILREVKRRRHYEKPSDRRKRKEREAQRRKRRKAARQ